MSPYIGLVKCIRYLRVVGLRDVIFKVSARTRPYRRLVYRASRRRDIGVIGCGQFGYAVIGNLLTRDFGACICACFDRDMDNAISFARAFCVPHIAVDVEELLSNPAIAVIYIASNHASHAEYAIAAMAAGKAVYVEKPIAVTFDQLQRLETTRRSTNSKMWIGYNRPHSSFVKELRAKMPISNSGFSISCYISGHVIPKEHWYRRAEEGTRICGNVGHWIDLALHIIGWRSIPTKYRVSVTPANSDEPDDNLVVAISTDAHDVISIMLSSRTEPFEGIRECVNVQHGNTICEIIDFRRMTIWQGAKRTERRRLRRDVGHARAVMQPFTPLDYRDCREIIQSTKLMLYIADMCRRNVNYCEVCV